MIYLETFISLTLWFDQQQLGSQEHKIMVRDMAQEDGTVSLGQYHNPNNTIFLLSFDLSNKMMQFGLGTYNLEVISFITGTARCIYSTVFIFAVDKTCVFRMIYLEKIIILNCF